MRQTSNDESEMKRANIEIGDSFDRDLKIAKRGEIENTKEMEEIDESLYSRQIYVLGSESMRRMNKTNVLVYGADGCGIEIAKNVILGGMRSLKLFDDRKCKLSDLSINYFLCEADIGKNIASASIKSLSRLNEYVIVDAITIFPSSEILQDIQIIVIVNKSYEEIDKIYAASHKYKPKIICVNLYGLVGRIFCDFGSDFVIFDPNGEDPVQAQINSIENTCQGHVICLDDKRHGFEDDAYVKFSEVEGMPEINNCTPFKIKVLTPYSFSIGDMSKFTSFGIGGIATQVKIPTKISFKNFRDSLKNPDFVISDFEKIDRPAFYHLLFDGVQSFFKQNGYLPKPHDAADADKIIKIVHSLNGINTPRVESLDDNFIKMFSFQASGNLCPMTSYFGGLAAQEIFKASSGKFTPIFQNLFYDCLEILPNNYIDLCSTDFQPIQSRYDDQIAIFGKNFQDKLSKMNVFVVGSGAIGCEHLKNLCMMGIGTEIPGEIRITDMDIIERSNLNRQFLFRNSDIGHFKSEAACRSAQEINQNVRFRPMIQRVGADTENIFNDNFYSLINIIMNALDNIDARTYMDQKCLFYQKPLLESGTLGPKGSVQVVIPHLTESYSSSYDPPEKSIPMCTLKNFPYLPEHVIQWGRDLFEGFFCQWPTLIKNFILNPKTLYKSSGVVDFDKIDVIKSALLSFQTLDFCDCIKWAKNAAKKHFMDEIEQLIFSFPKDKLNQYGDFFWSGTKRYPQSFNIYNSDSYVYQTFILSASKLRAFNFGIKCDMTDPEILEYEKTIYFEKFHPKSNFFIATTDSELNAQKSVDDSDSHDSKKTDEIEILQNYIRKVNFIFNDINFEKDDDTNNHVEFVYSAANLRAYNYRIPESDKLTVKLIAGKIIPAIATTTAAVSGLACLEFYKLAQGFSDISRFRNSFMNLAIGFSTFSEPIKCKVQKCGDIEFTMWDKWEIEALSYTNPGQECTMQEFFQLVKKKYRIDIDMISHGTCLVYASFMEARKRSERLFEPISKVIETITKKNLDKSIGWLLLDCTCLPQDDDDSDPPDIPSILYILPK